MSEVLESEVQQVGIPAKPISEEPAPRAWSARFRALGERGRVPITVAVSLSIFGLMAIHSILLSRLLGPQGRGEYGTAIFYAQSMIYIGLLGTHYSIARVASQGIVGSSALQRAAFRVGLVTGLGSMLVAMLLSLWGLPAEKSYLLPLCFVCSMLLPFEHLRQTAQAVDHGRGKFGRYNASRLFAGAVFPPIVALFYFFDYQNLHLICWMTALVTVVSYAFYYVLSDTKKLFGSSEPGTWKLIKDGLPDGGLVLVHDLFDRLTILLVIWICTLADQGIYLTAIPIATLLAVAPYALELFAFRVAADPKSNVSRSRFFKSLAIVLAVQLGIFVAIQIPLAPLVILLFGEAFESTIAVARILIVATFFGGISIVGEGYLRGRKLARKAISTRILSAMVMFGAVFLLPITEPLFRVATATVIGHGLNALLVSWIVFRDVLAEEQR